MTDWQPIETAPRDGTEVLLFTHQDANDFHDEAFDAVQVGFWDEGHVSADPMWSRDPGWFLQKVGMPSHWMPLPPPPSLGRAG